MTNESHSCLDLTSGSGCGVASKISNYTQGISGGFWVANKTRWCTIYEQLYFSIYNHNTSGFWSHLEHPEIINYNVKWQFKNAG